MKERRIHSSRRQFCKVLSGSVVSIAFESACHHSSESSVTNDGRLYSRPRADVKTSVSGQVEIDVNNGRPAILQLPKTITGPSLPLLVMLHGAGQNAEEMFWYLGSTHHEAGVAVLAPNSRDYTWDAIGDSYGVDVGFLNKSLARVFEMLGVDSNRLAIGGFSDGASYALSLGLINGDLFNRVVAFSPGFITEGTPNGKPRIFISHGTADNILPISRCGRRIAADLKGRGYDVTFREFEGGHEIPADVAREGLFWIANSNL